METFAHDCAGCNLCVKNCLFLQQYGNPGDIVRQVLEGSLDKEIAFQCSLCGLCAATCPKGLNPAGIFLHMRQMVFEENQKVFAEHKQIMAYEQRGLSKRFSLYTIPKNCTQVFWPGCALAGTRAKRTLQVYAWLKTRVPNLGIVLDCCAKPSHDLGRKAFFQSNFSSQEQFLEQHGVQGVITACPNCYRIFATYAQKLAVRSAYDLMAETWPDDRVLTGQVTIHDPCGTRCNQDIHASVRQLVRKTGLEIHEMPHSGEKTICCGQGGTVYPVAPPLALNWQSRRKAEAGNRKVITYCAGCCEFLGKSMNTSHVLDLLFEPQQTMNNRVKSTVSPFTYLARLWLKSRLTSSNRKDVLEKELPVNTCTRSGISPARLLVLLFIVAGIVGARIAGVDGLATQENIHRLVGEFGILAPAAFILLVTLAPAFFLPGAPFIIAGGVIFGPVWGVVYGITGATTGACLAFLVARYVASDWVEKKMTNPCFLKLKQQTEQHGWKIVAFTRLVPLFPFNLLSYALGLTRIKFSTYFFTSFICMLPGCVAYILLSSSLFDLLQGKWSTQCLAGIGLLVLLAFLPMVVKKYVPQGLKNKEL
ncbi:VTT domain-containing protein [Desulfoplanes formicivorans]|nr:VTT domain-containing protein [Desulfoplanes formicivorans]